MGRAPCCDKSKVKRGPWSPEEDETLKTYIHNNGPAGNWISLPQRAGLRRCGKSCRLRWLNYLRPDIKHGAFTEEEDLIIFTLHTQIGSRWSVIASQLQGRTDNDVKNRWNTKLKKMLTVTPPITHQTPVATSEAYLPANPPAMPALGPCLTADDPVYFPLDILEFNSRVSESSSLANYGWWSRGGAAGLLADSCGGVSTSNVMDGGSWCQEMLAETNSYMQM